MLYTFYHHVGLCEYRCWCMLKYVEFSALKIYQIIFCFQVKVLRVLSFLFQPLGRCLPFLHSHCSSSSVFGPNVPTTQQRKKANESEQKILKKVADFSFRFEDEKVLLFWTAGQATNYLKLMLSYVFNVVTPGSAALWLLAKLQLLSSGVEAL